MLAIGSVLSETENARLSLFVDLSIFPYFLVPYLEDVDAITFHVLVEWRK